MLTRRGFALVLAGGEGKRLWPLTADRAKPAVPFAGNYRLIDFALSNLVNGEFRRIAVLTQYKSQSLDRHLATTWSLSSLLGNYVMPVPAQMRRGPRWFAGSADAIYQSLNLIYDERPDYILVFGADHVYRTDPRQMIQQHLDASAGLTVAGIRVPIEQAGELGVIEPAADGRTIEAFHEKKPDVVGLADAPHQVLASMGNYVFDAEVLIDAVTADSLDPSSIHDIGTDIIPKLVAQGVAHVWDFADSVVPGMAEAERGYWRDVGTLDAYHDAHMDLVSVHPIFNLYNRQWPILSHMGAWPPAKFVEGGEAHESIVGAGTIVSGGLVDHSVVAFDVRIGHGAEVTDSVLLPGSSVGRGAIVRRAILDKGVVVPDRAKIGVDRARDAELYTLSESGVAVLGKNARAVL